MEQWVKPTDNDELFHDEHSANFAARDTEDNAQNICMAIIPSQQSYGGIQ